jgi:hypothetical protein
MALRAGDAEERVHSGRRRRSIRRRSAWTWCSKWHLGFIFTPSRTARTPLHRSGRRSYRSCGCSLVPTAVRGATAPLLHRGTNVQMRFTCIGHGAKCLKEETLDEMKERKVMRRRKKLMTELGFFPRQACLIYKYILMGLCKGKVQSICTGFYILPSANDKRRSSVSRQMVRRRRGKKSYLSRSASVPRLGLGGLKS